MNSGLAQTENGPIAEKIMQKQATVNCISNDGDGLKPQELQESADVRCHGWVMIPSRQLCVTRGELNVVKHATMP